MATLTEKIKCEQDAREMLRQQDVRQPDWVEYGDTCIRLFWEDTKVVLVVDIDDAPGGFGVLGDYLDGGDDSDDSDRDEDGDDFDYDDAAEELERLGSDHGHEEERMN